MVTERKSGIHDDSRFGDHKSTGYVVPDNAIVDVLSSFQMRLGLVLLDLTECPIFWG